MKKAPVPKAVFLGAGFAIDSLLLAEPSLAADTDLSQRQRHSHRCNRAY